MKIRIDDEVLEKYPEAEIGFLIAHVAVKKQDAYVDSLKSNLLEYLSGLGLNATNFVTHPNLARWRKIYKEDFLVKESTYRSSVEALVRRIVTGKGIWNICNVVDLYNCCSVLSLMPMGAYDLDKVAGSINIRFAKEGETFLGIGERAKIETKTNHVVYADDARVLCWLWNHKDAQDTCIDEDTNSALFFIDSAGGLKQNEMQKALMLLSEHLSKFGGVVTDSGVLNKEKATY